MLTDARPQLPAAMPTASLHTTLGVVDTPAVVHTAASVRELVNAVGLLVAELGVCAGTRWAEASSGRADGQTSRCIPCELRRSPGPR